MIRSPHGIVLVTGPTGSGKSTTLYAALSRIASETVNVSTIEDPVEYHLDAANQEQVDARIGVTFATGLRTLCGRDPDIIMVGKIQIKRRPSSPFRPLLQATLYLARCIPMGPPKP